MYSSKNCLRSNNLPLQLLDMIPFPRYLHGRSKKLDLFSLDQDLNILDYLQNYMQN